MSRACRLHVEGRLIGFVWKAVMAHGCTTDPRRYSPAAGRPSTHCARPRSLRTRGTDELVRLELDLAAQLPGIKDFARVAAGVGRPQCDSSR